MKLQFFGSLILISIAMQAKGTPFEVGYIWSSAEIESAISPLPARKAHESITIRRNKSGQNELRLRYDRSGGIDASEAASIFQALELAGRWRASSPKWRLEVRGTNNFARVSILEEAGCYRQLEKTRDIYVGKLRGTDWKEVSRNDFVLVPCTILH